MDLGNQRSSGNVVDRRGIGIGAGGLGIGGIIIAIVAAFLGFDPGQVLNTVESVQQASPKAQQQQGTEGVPTDAMGQFVSKVLGSTEDVWGALFKNSGKQYRQPKLVLYTGAVRSACGLGQSAMGPFYCPNDEQLYIDLAFYEDLKRRFRAPGDFAQAYVIAHEVGHHIQKLTGQFSRMENAQGRMGKVQYNELSVRMELQADCYAGVWGHHAHDKNMIDPSDVDEALTAASAIGDDRLQKQTQGRVVPESFTHGSSAQRMRWFKRGLDSGNPSECNTFDASVL